MAGFLFFDPRHRLCLTVDDETIRPGDSVRALVWAAKERRWGAPTSVAYVRPARVAELSEDDCRALDAPVHDTGLSVRDLRTIGMSHKPLG